MTTILLMLSLGKKFAVTEGGRTCNEKDGTISLSSEAECERAVPQIQDILPGISFWGGWGPHTSECYIERSIWYYRNVWWGNKPPGKNVRSICKRGNPAIRA